MSTLLGRLASWPRNRYTDNGHDLDMAFITPEIVVMSLPSVRFPERLYRNNLQAVKRALDDRFAEHGYTVFDLRAEGAGYEDAAFDGHVRHFPFIDHQPPTFALLLTIIEALHAYCVDGKVAVIHCKAGKGRSGLVTCSFLVTYRHWAEEEARRHFTKLRMRPGFGEGVSIPSQQRWLRYIAHWSQTRFEYTAGRVRLDKITVTNLRAGCKLSINGFEQEGQRIVTKQELHPQDVEISGDLSTWQFDNLSMDEEICIYLAKGHAFAHFWFNAQLEAHMHDGKTSFSIAWEEVDGWKGTKWRGSRAYDAVTVYWTRI